MEAMNFLNSSRGWPINDNVNLGTINMNPELTHNKPQEK